MGRRCGFVVLVRYHIYVTFNFCVEYVDVDVGLASADTAALCSGRWLSVVEISIELYFYDLLTATATTHHLRYSKREMFVGLIDSTMEENREDLDFVFEEENFRCTRYENVAHGRYPYREGQGFALLRDGSTDSSSIWKVHHFLRSYQSNLMLEPLGFFLGKLLN